MTWPETVAPPMAVFEGRKLRVPHVAAWSSEVATVIRACPYSGEPSFFGSGGAQGRGTPVWGEMNFERQRRSMWERRCQVCDAKLSKGESLLLLWDGVQHDDKGRPAVMEPWLCKGCQGYAYAACPGLRRDSNTYVMVDPKVELLATQAQLKDGRVGISYFKALVLNAPTLR